MIEVFNYLTFKKGIFGIAYNKNVLLILDYDISDTKRYNRSTNHRNSVNYRVNQIY